MLEWFDMTDCPKENIPKVGQIFRVGKYVGRCISSEYDKDMEAIICGMDLDFMNTDADEAACERRAEAESLGHNWW